MATTYTLISSVTVGSGGAANIDFSSIPATYTDLVVLLSGRTTRSAVTDSIYIKFNNNATGYSFRDLDSDGSSVSSSNAADYPPARVSANTATANTFGSWSAYIPNYASTSVNKSVSLEGMSETNATTAFMRITAGLWANTSAINQITLISQNPVNFMQYSTAYLYGISNA
jgi:hypothetical protein